MIYFISAQLCVRSSEFYDVSIYIILLWRIPAMHIILLVWPNHSRNFADKLCCYLLTEMQNGSLFMRLGGKEMQRGVHLDLGAVEYDFILERMQKSYSCAMWK